MQLGFQVVDHEIADTHPSWWCDFMRLFLKEGETFEIRHWSEEPDVIADALRYGAIDPDKSTAYETSVVGKISRELIEDLLIGAYYECETQNQPTKFFTIQTVKVSSEHYGNEMYFSQELTEEERQKIERLLEPIREYLSIDRWD